MSLTAHDPAPEDSFSLEKVSLPAFDPEADSQTPTVVDKCPDGGLKAWLVVLGLSVGSCTSFGLVQAWGVFQAYYTETLLADTSPSNIAWIGSIQYSFGFMPGILFGRLFDMGYLRLPMLFASALLVVATIVTGQCTEYWQFLLCQGVATGIASGILFTAIVGTYAHWFDKRLGLAYAVGSFGSSMGGMIFPIIIRNLLQHQSFQWTMRITGFIVFGFLVICNLTIARRLPPKNHRGPFFRLVEFRSPAYCTYTLAAFVEFLGLYTLLTYLDFSALDVGVDVNLSFYLLAIVNAISMIGRLVSGVLADRYGPLNIMIPGSLLTAIITYAWPFAKTKGSLLAITVLYGLSCGTFTTLMAQPVVRMGDIQNIGNRSGMISTIMSLGALAGPPISGALLDSTGNFEAVGYYAGSCLVVAAALLAVTRQLMLKQWVGNA